MKRTDFQILEVDLPVPGLPTDLDKNVDRLLEGPHGLRSTTVDRCLKDHGTGYQYPPKK